MIQKIKKLSSIVLAMVMVLTFYAMPAKAVTPLAEGEQTVTVELWNSAGTAVAPAWVVQTATINTVGGVSTMRVDTQMSAQGSATAYLKDFTVDGSYTDATAGVDNADGFPTSFSFSITQGTMDVNGIEMLPINVTYMPFPMIPGFPFVNGHNIPQHLRIDWSTLASTVNTTALTSKVAEASAITASGYTTASYATLQSAITNAGVVLADINATQAEVDAQVVALQVAIDGLLAPMTVAGLTGNQSVSVALWNSGGTAVAPEWLLADATITTVNGVSTMTVTTQMSAQGSATAYLKDFTINGSYTDATAGENNEDGFPVSFTFPITQGSVDENGIEMLPIRVTYMPYPMIPGFPFVNGHDIGQHLRVDWSTLSIIVDKSELTDVIAEAVAIEAEGYTAESYAILQTAIANAQAVLADATATQATVNTQAVALRTAINGLVNVNAGGTQNTENANNANANTENTNNADTGNTNAGNTNNVGANGKQAAAKTGDTASTMLFVVISAIAILVGGVTIYKRKKQK